MNFNLKLWESFIYTLIQINTNNQIDLITFQFFDPPYSTLRLLVDCVCKKKVSYSDSLIKLKFFSLKFISESVTNIK